MRFAQAPEVSVDKSRSLCPRKPVIEPQLTIAASSDVL